MDAVHAVDAVDDEVDEIEELVHEPRPNGVAERLDRFQRSHRWLGFPLAVIYKFADDQGIYLAVVITYYGFLSLFPLLLLLASIVGFLLQDNTSLQQDILNSTVSQFPILREQLADPEGLRGSTPAVVIGAVVALYGALGIAHAVQNAMNTAWAVPRNRRPNPILIRARGFVLILIAGITIIATTILSGIATMEELETSVAVSDGQFLSPKTIEAIEAV